MGKHGERRSDRPSVRPKTFGQCGPQSLHEQVQVAVVQGAEGDTGEALEAGAAVGRGRRLQPVVVHLHDESEEDDSEEARGTRGGEVDLMPHVKLFSMSTTGDKL